MWTGRIVMFVALWNVTNIGLVLLNKVIMTDQFRHPICLTTLHQLACYGFSRLCITLGFVAEQTPNPGRQTHNLMLLSQSFSWSIVTGIWCLQYIPVSFDQAVGSTTPAWVALIGFVFLRRIEKMVAYCALIPVMVGIIIASRGEMSFHIVGFLLSVASTVLRAVKSIMQQVLMTEGDIRLDSLNALRCMAPYSAVSLLPFSLLIEGLEPWKKLVGVFPDDPLVDDGIEVIANEGKWAALAGALSINCTAAFLVNLFNFLVTQHTSALTVQVLGNAKGILASVISILLFKNPISVTGMLGYTITMMGVALYTWAKTLPQDSPDEVLQAIGQPQPQMAPLSTIKPKQSMDYSRVDSAGSLEFDANHGSSSPSKKKGEQNI